MNRTQNKAPLIVGLIAIVIGAGLAEFSRQRCKALTPPELWGWPDWANLLPDAEAFFGATLGDPLTRWTLVLGTVFLLLGAALVARWKGRSYRWSVLGLFSLLGIAVLLLIPSKSIVRVDMAGSRHLSRVFLVSLGIAVVGCALMSYGTIAWNLASLRPSESLLFAERTGDDLLADPTSLALAGIGLVVYMIGLGALSRSKGQSMGWAMSAVLSVLGLIIALFLPDRAPRGSQAEQ